MLTLLLSTATAAPPELPAWCREVTDRIECRDAIDQGELEALVAFARARGNITDVSLYEFTGNDVSALGALHTLDHLGLTRVERGRPHHGLDLSSLAQLTRLKMLALRGVGPTDLTPLAELPQLEWLLMAQMEGTELGPVARIPALKTLVLQHNSFGDLSALAGAAQLRNLEVSTHSENPLEGVENLTQVDNLSLSLPDQAPDLTPITELTGLTELAVCFDRRAPPPDWTVLTALPKLEELRLSCAEPGVLEAAQAAMPGVEVDR